MRDSAKVKGKKVTAKSGSEFATIAANADRSCLWISNYGEKSVTVCLAPGTPTFEEGPMLAEKGGSVLIESYSGAVNLITKEGSSVVGYVDF